MTASSGATLAMSVMWVARPIRPIPVISPSPAVTSGIPAVISEPNVSSRITSAASTPTDVAGPMLKPSACSITWPPAASCRPGTRIASIALSTGLPVSLGSRFARLS